MEKTIWYVVNNWSSQIDELEVIGETPKMLILNERRYNGKPRKTAKDSQWSKHFRTKAEAINHIHQRLKQTKIRSESFLKNAQDSLGDFEAEYGLSYEDLKTKGDETYEE